MPTSPPFSGQSHANALDDPAPVDENNHSGRSLFQDLVASIVVFLVALPLCLGVAIASGAPPLSGLIAGIIGGVVVGFLSGSHTSVSGPAAGLTAVVAAQIATLGSLDGFLLAVVIAGLIQVALGLCRAGFIASFFPSSVIQGLLSAIGLILILKQFPHLLGHDPDPEGEMAFSQPDSENTFTELMRILGDWHAGAAVIGVISLLVLVAWDRVKIPLLSRLPGPLVVVGLGIALADFFQKLGGPWLIGEDHLVNVPVVKTLSSLPELMVHPDFSRLAEPAIWAAAVTLALVASLETLLNLEAVDKLDPRHRFSPTNRELMAQGAGNMLSGLVGGLPITSVIVRSSVNINAGAQSRLSTVFHGLLLFLCVLLLPGLLGRIPVSCLAAILLLTGFKLASPKVFGKMWQGGKDRFVPFLVTVFAILFTDLLVGVVVGLAVSLGFILASNMRKPLRSQVERHHTGEIRRISLANQVSFLSRGALERALQMANTGTHLLIDASETNYIDSDVLELIREFRDVTGPARGVTVSLRGFRDRFGLPDSIQFQEHVTRELQEKLTWKDVLDLFIEGNRRFHSGNRLPRDLNRQLQATASGQHPLAVVLSCMDSRSPAEILFDLGLGDILSVRIAGNVTSPKLLGSIDYAVTVAGAKLVVVLGHTRCGAIAAAIERNLAPDPDRLPPISNNLLPIISDIREAVVAASDSCRTTGIPTDSEAFRDDVTHRNVVINVKRLLEDSEAVSNLVRQGQLAVVGAVYDVKSGRVEFIKVPGGIPDNEAGLYIPAFQADSARQVVVPG